MKYMVIIHHLIGIIPTGSVIKNRFLMFKITWDLMKGFYEIVF